MMVLSRPQFESMVGSERVVRRAFNVRTLAGLRRSGLGAAISSSVSRPDVLATAEAELASQGIRADCVEEVYQLPEGPATYSRLCTPVGSDIGLSADVIARDSTQAQWWQDLQATRLASEMAAFNSDVDPYVDPNFRPYQPTAADLAQQKIFEQQAKEALRVSAPTLYAPVTTGVGPSAPSPGTPTRTETDRTVTGNGSAADRQPGTMETVGGGEETAGGGGFLGLDTTTLMLLGIGAIGLMVAMKGK